MNSDDAKFEAGGAPKQDAEANHNDADGSQRRLLFVAQPPADASDAELEALASRLFKALRSELDASPLLPA
jgi:hypothetical protein